MLIKLLLELKGEKNIKVIILEECFIKQNQRKKLKSVQRVEINRENKQLKNNNDTDGSNDKLVRKTFTKVKN